MNRFARDIVLIFVSDVNSALLKDTLADHFFGAAEVQRWLDENFKRMQLAYVPVIEREFNVVDPMEGTTARDHAQIFNSQFLKYAIKQLETEIVPDLVADFSVFDRVEKRNMRRTDMSADEILHSWLDNPAPLDQYRDDPQACLGGAKYTPAFDNAGYYCNAVKGTQMACGDSSTNYRLGKFSPQHTWKSPAAQYPWITDTDSSRDMKQASSRDFGANKYEADQYETFSNSNFTVGGRKYNEPNVAGGMGQPRGHVASMTNKSGERFREGPPVNSQCNTMTQKVFANDKPYFGHVKQDNFESSPPARYGRCGAKVPLEESMASSKPKVYAECGLNPYAPYKNNIENMSSSKPKNYEQCKLNPYAPYENKVENMSSSKPKNYEQCGLNPYAPYRDTARPLAGQRNGTGIYNKHTGQRRENMTSERSEQMYTPNEAIDFDPYRAQQYDVPMPSHVGGVPNTAWRCNTGRIPDGGAGINFCDQSYLGGSLSYDMMTQTMFVQELNKDPEPHIFQPFGWACPEGDNRLLSRRTFRKNEAGVENGIPRYEQRLQRRNLDRDIDEDLSVTQYGYKQRGHDMSDLWTRTNNKKHVIDVDRDKLNVTDKIKYDSLWQKSNYP